MAGGGFMGRVISYVAQELLVKGLANSHAFQRFAVRTSGRIEDLSKKVAEKKTQLKSIKESLQNQNQKQ